MQSGLLVSGEGRSLLLEEIDGADSNGRPRRSLDDEDADGHVVIYESAASGGECGLKPKNAKRMRAPDPEVVSLLEDDDVEDGDREFFVRRRKKRAANKDKAIELAVFVDDDLYAQEKAANGNADPVSKIQELVFTYLNSVQLLYNHDRLDTKFRILLVRLEVFRSRMRSIDKAGGDIERYLDSFCGWQKSEKSSELRDTSLDAHIFGITSCYATYVSQSRFRSIGTTACC